MSKKRRQGSIGCMHREDRKHVFQESFQIIQSFIPVQPTVRLFVVNLTGSWMLLPRAIVKKRRRVGVTSSTASLCSRFCFFFILPNKSCWEKEGFGCGGNFFDRLQRTDEPANTEHNNKKKRCAANIFLRLTVQYS